MGWLEEIKALLDSGASVLNADDAMTLIERCERLRQENAALSAALEAVEWDHNGVCLWCWGSKHGRGHRPRCQRQAALKGKG